MKYYKLDHRKMYSFYENAHENQETNLFNDFDEFFLITILLNKFMDVKMDQD